MPFKRLLGVVVLPFFACHGGFYCSFISQFAEGKPMEGFADFGAGCMH